MYCTGTCTCMCMCMCVGGVMDRVVNQIIAEIDSINFLSNTSNYAGTNCNFFKYDNLVIKLYIVEEECLNLS